MTAGHVVSTPNPFMTAAAARAPTPSTVYLAAPTWGGPVGGPLGAPAASVGVVNPLMSLLSPSPPSAPPPVIRVPPPVPPKTARLRASAMWVRVPSPEGQPAPGPFYYFHRKTGETTWGQPPSKEGIISLQVRNGALVHWCIGALYSVVLCCVLLCCVGGAS